MKENPALTAGHRAQGVGSPCSEGSLKAFGEEVLKEGEAGGGSTWDPLVPHSHTDWLKVRVKQHQPSGFSQPGVCVHMASLHLEELCLL